MAADTSEVSLGDVLSSIGRRSFGPVLLLTGLVTLAPIIGDVPSVPTMMGLIVLLTAAQLATHAEHFWLPRWLLNRSVSSEKMRKAVTAIRKPSRFIDRLLKPRLSGAGSRCFQICHSVGVWCDCIDDTHDGVRTFQR